MATLKDLADGSAELTALYRYYETATLTIANGQTVSDAFDARGLSIFGLVVPAEFDGTTITFQASADGTNFFALYTDAGTQVSITVAASRALDLPAALEPWPYWKVVAGTSQTGATSIPVVAKG
jgi:hypothetical protein